MYFSKLECLLHISYITSYFPAQNTTLHSARGNKRDWDHMSWLGLADDNKNKGCKPHSQGMNGELPSPRKSQLPQLGGHPQPKAGWYPHIPQQPEQWVTCSPQILISSTGFIPISVSRDQEHKVTLISRLHSSRSLFLPKAKAIASFIFNPRLFSWG